MPGLLLLFTALTCTMRSLVPSRATCSTMPRRVLVASRLPSTVTDQSWNTTASPSFAVG